MTDRISSREVTPAERAVIALQLGRTPRDLTGVAVRCPFGHAVVIETAPVLSDGTPNPTLLYLTCPTLSAAVSRVEAGGGVRVFKDAVRDDPCLRAALERITTLYRARRTALLEPSTKRAAVRLEAGIGGPASPEQASCLHAYAGALLAVVSGWLRAAETGRGPTGTLAGEDSWRRVAAEAGDIWERFYPRLAACWCRDNRCSQADGSVHRRAVIDVGTISVRLLVADVSGETVDTVVRRTEVTRLGQGLRPGERLLPEAAERTADAMSRFAEEARQLGAEAAVMVGTSAVREAADGRAFLTAVGDRVQVKTVVLSGREEAEAGYAGVVLDVPGDPVVVDIGGGSTEISRRRGIRFETTSLDLGATKASERWLAGDPPVPAAVERARKQAERIIGPAAARFTGGVDATDAGVTRLVGVAGTVTTIACLAAGLSEYDRDALHLRSLSRAEVKKQFDRLSAMTLEQRAALACVQAGRAPLIVGGAAILLAVMDALGFSELTVSERDLLDGLALFGPW